MEAYKKFARIYDRLIKGDIDYDRWSSRILEVCKEYDVAGEDYLDLACGTGNITALLAPYFKRSWGVDFSEEMLIEADEKTRKGRQRVNFVCQDMRFLNLNRKFDLISCCLDSLNYIVDKKDIEMIFKTINSHLKDKGLFIFDINSFNKLSTIMGNNTFIHNSEEVVYIWENTFENNIVNMFLTFFVKSGKLYERFEEEHEERAYREGEIEELLTKCNLEIVKKMDNYHDKHVSNETERIVYIVRKI